MRASLPTAAVLVLLGAALGAPPAAASDGERAICPLDRVHLHGEACGHVFRDGAWRLFPAEHEHGRGCGHYYVGPDVPHADGGWDWFPSAHRHSAACGHSFYEEMWHPFAQGHVHGEGCGHWLWRGCWQLFPEGHVHGRGCGHAFVDGEWRPWEPGPATARADEPGLPLAAEPQVVEPRPPLPSARAARAVELPAALARLRPIEPVAADEEEGDRIVAPAAARPGQEDR